MKNDILVRHGVGPLDVQMIRNPLNSSRSNAVHFLKQKSCRTVVALSRASTSLQPLAGKKTWMAGTSPRLSGSKNLESLQAVERTQLHSIDWQTGLGTAKLNHLNRLAPRTGQPWVRPAMTKNA
jgi:hypothetical protein